MSLRIWSYATSDDDTITYAYWYGTGICKANADLRIGSRRRVMGTVKGSHLHNVVFFLVVIK